MPRGEILRRIAEALTELQEESGREATKISEDMKPIGDLDGFDSHAGLELACALEQKLDIEIPLDENLCVDDEKRRARTVKEIVERVIELQKGK